MGREDSSGCLGLFATRTLLHAGHWEGQRPQRHHGAATVAMAMNLRRTPETATADRGSEGKGKKRVRSSDERRRKYNVKCLSVNRVLTCI